MTIPAINIQYGRQETRASDLISSTNTVAGINPAEILEQGQPAGTTAFHLMVASQNVLAKDWDRPEEDEAWAYLSKGK